ncbi:hypothetical protein [Nocardioides lianchengensis]|uniref:Uncharacterized protein n=1 Tax=Nocardioides lianchengensis TaxID=1045774 RepID=A0A1G6JTP9_9ACTN|nr:hypothetical protein [Nocardioides lianchengensis]NYG08755.1 hypothetical protein [Nocardioides lianchengensis]SDC21366.1 hypothetical protein SAMN05421872_101561 [Nocardioides lianchengensis]
MVTAEDLATWTGVPRRVAGPDETSGEVECRTIGDPDDGHLVRWTFEPSSGDHEEDVAGATTSAAERQDVEVPGGGPAVVLTDESLKAVTVLSWTASDELLSVEVLDSGTGAQDLTTDHLAEVATRITAAYAASGSDAGR